MMMIVSRVEVSEVLKVYGAVFVFPSLPSLFDMRGKCKKHGVCVNHGPELYSSFVCIIKIVGNLRKSLAGVWM